jgi:hypothetical protein
MWPLFFISKGNGCPNLELVSRSGLIRSDKRNWIMLVERGVRVMNMGLVGDAYAIASNYLRRTGAIPDNLITDERLLAIIVEMFQRGEVNKLKLANKAIAKFEALENV